MGLLSRYRSARTGRYTTEAEAKANEDTTIRETISTATVLNVKPGDTLVFKFKSRASQETIDKVRERIAAKFPGHQILVLDSDTDISLIRPET